MEQKYQMSYFVAPITNTRPNSAVSVLQIYEFITEYDSTLRHLTEEVRRAPNLDVAKRTRLPFVTPCGVFKYRQREQWMTVSGLFPLDIDGLASTEEAELMRDHIASDPYLRPVLTYVSPGGRGVKAFVPYSYPHSLVSECHNDKEARKVIEKAHETAVRYAMNYTNAVYGTCDGSGKDLARSCFLCYDERAKLNLQVTNI